MEVKAFDTHKYIKELQSSGFDENQAEVIVKSLLESREYDFSKLATREQVSNLEKNSKEQHFSLDKQMIKFATKEQITNLEKNTKEQISSLEKQMIKFATKEQITNLEKNTKEQISSLEKSMNDKFLSFKENIDTKIRSNCQEVQNNIIKWVVPLIAIQILAVFYKIFFS